MALKSLSSRLKDIKQFLAKPQPKGVGGGDEADKAVQEVDIVVQNERVATKRTIELIKAWPVHFYILVCPSPAQPPHRG